MATFRTRLLRLVVLVSCGIVVDGAAVAADAAPQRFWFGGEDPVTVRDKHRSQPADFMALFRADAPWHEAASKTTAFKMSMQFASGASDDQLKTVIDDLKQRGIALAIEMGMLRNDRGCGKGEGYMPQDLLRTAMNRIHRLGGQVDDVAMDEVVFFGREKNWPDQPGQVSCQDSIEEIVHEVAASAKAIHAVFPQARIGAVEPLTTVHDIDLHRLIHDDIEFADRYLAETGSSLAFFHVDIAWRSKNWQPGLAPLKAGMKARGIRFGIIVGGNPDQKDDLSWTAAGLGHLKTFDMDPATRPDDVVIQSWQPLPTSYLPESRPGTSAWMLHQAELLP